MKKMERTPSTSFRLPAASVKLLEQFAKKTGMTKTQALVVLLDRTREKK